MRCPELAQTTALGASIAVNGACLTVARRSGVLIDFDVVPETLSRTNLGNLKAGDAVNLEPSLRLGDELGGHMVYGHVDATAKVIAKEPEGQGFWLTLEMPPKLSALIVEKGYVALDGVSVTVASVDAGRANFEVALVPETIKRTTLGRKGAGASLNVEADPVARYLASLLRSR